MEDCKHYWVVPSAESPDKLKTCRLCNEVKDFSIIAADEFTLHRKPTKNLMYGYKGGRPKGKRSA
jgi:hypothetical protein